MESVTWAAKEEWEKDRVDNKKNPRKAIQKRMVYYRSLLRGDGGCGVQLAGLKVRLAVRHFACSDVGLFQARTGKRREKNRHINIYKYG